MLSTRSLPDNGMEMSLDFGEGKGAEEQAALKMAIQPMYYDYYGGEFMAHAPPSGQTRLHQPQKCLTFSLLSFFFGNGMFV